MMKREQFEDYIQEALENDIITYEEAVELSTGTDNPVLCNMPILE